MTYRPSWLREQVIQAVDIFVLARTSGREELAFLGSTLPAVVSEGAGISEALARLPRGEFLLVQRNRGHHPSAVTFVAAPRQTIHVRHLTKYVDACVPPGREFRFRGADGRVARRPTACTRFAAWSRPRPTRCWLTTPGTATFRAGSATCSPTPSWRASCGKIEARWRRRELADLRRTIDALITVRYGADD